MRKALITAVAAVSVLSAAVVAPIDVANAYPPGTAMTVSASPNPVGVGQSVTVSAGNVKPGCKVEFKFGEREAKATATGGSASVTLKAPSKAGTYRVSASCGSEKASSSVQVVGRGEVEGPGHVCKSKSFNVNVRNFVPGSKVSVVLRKSTPVGGTRGRTVAFVKSSHVGSAGTATYRFKVSTSGVYVVSAVSAGQRAATAISVDKC